MAWTTLPTYSDGTALTAAHVLAIAENINQTAVALANASGDYFIASGTNALVKRRIASNAVTTTSTTTSTSYTTNPSGDDGAEVTVTTGAAVLIWHSAQQENTASSNAVWSSFAISGATTDAADDNRAIMTNNAANVGFRGGVTTYLTPTGGSNVFTMAYKVTTSGTMSIDDRRIHVMSMS